MGPVVYLNFITIRIFEIDLMYFVGPVSNGKIPFGSVIHNMQPGKLLDKFGNGSHTKSDVIKLNRTRILNTFYQVKLKVVIQPKPVNFTIPASGNRDAIHFKQI